MGAPCLLAVLAVCVRAAAGACVDHYGWTSSGLGCGHFASNPSSCGEASGAQVGRDGTSAREACCVCGGGSLWVQVGSGSEVLRDDARPTAVLSAAWAPDGGRLATGSEGGGEAANVHLWDGSAAQWAALGTHPGAVRAVAWAPDGAGLATASERDVRLWDVGAGAVLHVLPAAEGAAVRCVAWSPGGALVAVGTDEAASNGAGGAVSIFDAVRGTLVRVLGAAPLLAWQVWSLAWSPDGAFLSGGMGDGSVGTWDAAAWAYRETRPLAHLLQPGGTYIAYSPDGTKLAVGGAFGVSVFSPAHCLCPDPCNCTAGEGRPRRSPEAAASLAWAPDGVTLAGGYADGAIRIWNTTQGAGDVVTELRGAAGGDAVLHAVAWSAEGALVSAGGMPLPLTTAESSVATATASTGTSSTFTSVGTNATNTSVGSGAATSNDTNTLVAIESATGASTSTSVDANTSAASGTSTSNDTFTSNDTYTTYTTDGLAGGAVTSTSTFTLVDANTSATASTVSDWSASPEPSVTLSSLTSRSSTSVVGQALTGPVSGTVTSFQANSPTNASAASGTFTFFEANATNTSATAYDTNTSATAYDTNTSAANASGTWTWVDGGTSSASAAASLAASSAGASRGSSSASAASPSGPAAGFVRFWGALASPKAAAVTVSCLSVGASAYGAEEGSVHDHPTVQQLHRKKGVFEAGMAAALRRDAALNATLAAVTLGYACVVPAGLCISVGDTRATCADMSVTPGRAGRFTQPLQGAGTFAVLTESTVSLSAPVSYAADRVVGSIQDDLASAHGLNSAFKDALEDGGLPADGLSAGMLTASRSTTPSSTPAPPPPPTPQTPQPRAPKPTPTPDPPPQATPPPTTVPNPPSTPKPLRTAVPPTPRPPAHDETPPPQERSTAGQSAGELALALSLPPIVLIVALVAVRVWARKRRAAAAADADPPHEPADAGFQPALEPELELGSVSEVGSEGSEAISAPVAPTTPPPAALTPPMPPTAPPLPHELLAMMGVELWDPRVGQVVCSPSPSPAQSSSTAPLTPPPRDAFLARISAPRID
eukprot:TRINITY_DN4182_c0_g1_i1.p1 TRINITY_DN4182_c0_g1~~TRINITY_DN4182_c0_g1_i1.p1  ORF type:complete len:1056 (+),score=185.15 TRINITY_DN4182_c0_g1_i1:48-3215(+)